MFLWIIQISLISIIFIFLVHNIISFFTTTLTIPKIKDLVTSPTQKYEDMFNIISANKSNTYLNNDINANDSNSNANANENLDMKDELKNFLKQQLTSENIESKYEIQKDTTDISTLDSFSEKYTAYQS